MSPESFEWEDPPPAVRRGKWSDIVDRLRERPNTWARIWAGDETDRDGKAYQVAQSLRKHADVETLVREKRDVYARFVVDDAAKPRLGPSQRPRVAEDE
jgi:hypothetical protein